MKNNITKYNCRYGLRCTKNELDFWRKKAADNNMSLSEYIRQCLNDGKFKRKQIDPILLRQISAIGNNLNQVAFWVNTYKKDADVQNVVQRLDDIRKDTKNICG